MGVGKPDPKKGYFAMPLAKTGKGMFCVYDEKI